MEHRAPGDRPDSRQRGTLGRQSLSPARHGAGDAILGTNIWKKIGETDKQINLDQPKMGFFLLALALCFHAQLELISSSRPFLRLEAANQFFRVEIGQENTSLMNV